MDKRIVVAGGAMLIALLAMEYIERGEKPEDKEGGVLPASIARPLSLIHKPDVSEEGEEIAPQVIKLPEQHVTFPTVGLATPTTLLPTAPVSGESKKEITEQKKKLEGTPMPEYFERMGHGGKVTVSSSKKTSLPKDWEKGSPYWEQAMKEPEKFSERSVWEVAKKIETQKKSTSKSTTKKTTEKKPPSLPGVTWVKKGSGWTATRSRASFVRSFGW